MSGKELINNVGLSNVITVLTVIVSGCALYFGLKGDNMQTRADMNAYHVEAHNELTLAVSHIKNYIDSNFRVRDRRLDLLEIKPNTVYKYRTLPSQSGFYTQHKDANGNLTFQSANQ